MKFWGGGNRQVIEVASRLSAKYDLMMFMGPTSQLTEQRLSQARLRFSVHSFLSTNSPIYWSCMPLANRFAASRLRESLSEYDAVITSYLSANMIASAAHDNVLYYCFEPFSLFYNRTAIRSLTPSNRLFWEPLGRLYRSLDIKATRRAKSVLTIDQYTSDFIRRLYGRQSLVTRSGVDTVFFSPRTDTRPGFEKYSGKRVILSQTHGYSYFDGCEYLLCAAASLKRRHPGVHVIFTSMFTNPARLAFLESLARGLGMASSVEFLGFVDEGLLPYYYALADVVVQPAIDINTLLTVKEAMSCERPVIVFEGGPAEDIRGADCGMVVPKQSATRLAEAMDAILGDRGLAARMGRNGRRRAIDLFSWDSVAANVGATVDAALRS